MAYDMTPDRIEKLQCAFCGSRLKKIAEVYHSGDVVVGKSIVCCNCGHVDNFAQNVDGIAIFASAQRSGIKRLNIVCGLCDANRRRCNMKTCDIGYFDSDDEPDIIQLVQEAVPVGHPAPHTPPEFEARPKPKPTQIATDTWKPTIAAQPVQKDTEQTVREVQAMSMAEARPMNPYEKRDTHDDEVRVLQSLQVNENEEKERVLEQLNPVNQIDPQVNRINPQINDYNPVMAGASRILTPKVTQNANDMKIGTVIIGPKYN